MTSERLQWIIPNVNFLNTSSACHAYVKVYISKFVLECFSYAYCKEEGNEKLKNPNCIN